MLDDPASHSSQVQVRLHVYVQAQVQSVSDRYLFSMQEMHKLATIDSSG